jgi:hypothetical protein
MEEKIEKYHAAIKAQKSASAAKAVEHTELYFKQVRCKKQERKENGLKKRKRVDMKRPYMHLPGNFYFLPRFLLSFPLDSVIQIHAYRMPRLE